MLTVVTATEFDNTADDVAGKDTSTTSHEDIAVMQYRRLFQHRRLDHLEAIKKLVGINSSVKQKAVIHTLFSKLFSMLSQARVHLMESSFTPGDPFPTEETLRDTFSLVLENTALFGDIVLRLPDTVHAVLIENDEWKTMAHWAINFVNDTKIFVNNEKILLNLMAQELGVIEKESDYVNPFKTQAQVEQAVDQELARVLAEQKRKQLQKEKREEKKKKYKGPRMSAPPRNEL